jgi:deoxycytidylate deaminase
MNPEIRQLAKESFPIELWEEAYKQAKRSTLGSFKTGAVIFNRDFNIVSKGCSHHRAWSPKPTVHAEEHALKELSGFTGKPNILIVTIGRSGNPAWSSKPCVSCATMLCNHYFDDIIWPERNNMGEWTINIESSAGLSGRIARSEIRLRGYARDMRT